MRTASSMASTMATAWQWKVPVCSSRQSPYNADFSQQREGRGSRGEIFLFDGPRHGATIALRHQHVTGSGRGHFWAHWAGPKILLAKSDAGSLGLPVVLPLPLCTKGPFVLHFHYYAIRNFSTRGGPFSIVPSPVGGQKEREKKKGKLWQRRHQSGQRPPPDCTDVHYRIGERSIKTERKTPEARPGSTYPRFLSLEYVLQWHH